MEKRGLSLVLLTALVSGFAIFVNKLGVGGIDSSVFTFSKNIVVAAFLLSLIVLVKEHNSFITLTRKHWFRLLLIGFLGGSVPFVLFFRGLQLAQATTAAFIHKTMFLFVGLMALVFLKEKLNRKFIIAAIVLLLGNSLLIGLTWEGLGMGELMILAATLLWSGEQVLSKDTLKEVPSKMVAFGRMFFGSLFILIYLGAAGKLPLIASLSLNQVGWILVTSGFLFFYVLTWYGGIKSIQVSVAACVLLLGSVITTLLSFAFLDKVLTLNQVVGMLLLVAGVVIAVGFTNISRLIKYPWSRKYGWN